MNIFSNIISIRKGRKAATRDIALASKFDEDHAAKHEDPNFECNTEEVDAFWSSLGRDVLGSGDKIMIAAYAEGTAAYKHEQSVRAIANSFGNLMRAMSTGDRSQIGDILSSMPPGSVRKIEVPIQLNGDETEQEVGERVKQAINDTITLESMARFNKRPENDKG